MKTSFEKMPHDIKLTMLVHLHVRVLLFAPVPILHRNLNNLQKLGDFSLFLDHVSNGILVGREEESVDHVDDTVVSFNRLYNPFSID